MVKKKLIDFKHLHGKLSTGVAAITHKRRSYHAQTSQLSRGLSQLSRGLSQLSRTNVAAITRFVAAITQWFEVSKTPRRRHR